MRLMLVGQSWLGGEVLALLLAQGHDVASVATPGGGRLHRAAVDAGVPVGDPGRILAPSWVPPGVDLIVAAHAHCFIRKDARERARLGAIGYHPSLLPRHRGRDAVRWTIHMRDQVAGGTVYWMTDRADGGPIAAQDWCHVRGGDTAESLWRRELGPMGVRLLGSVLRDVAAGRLVRVPQDEALATWEPAFDRPALSRAGGVGLRPAQFPYAAGNFYRQPFISTKAGDLSRAVTPSTAASRPDNAPSPTDPELKGFFAIPGTETMIRLGGYAKLDAIADGRAAGDTEQFVTSSIPVGGPHRDVSHFDMHAKQTRFSFEARRPTSHGNLRFYLENDFFGSSDSYQFRLRHAYGQLGNTYAGYGYSTFMDADSLPDTLDFAGPGGAGYLLVAGIHHSFALGKGNSLTIAAEDPDAQLANTGDSDISADRFPDVSLVARMERNWGHLQLGAVARSLGYDGDGRSDRTFGGGLQLSGSFAVAERDLLLFGLLGGKGMGRYTADLTGSGLDAAINADGRLKALPLYGGFFGYTHYWSEMWRSNLIYGELHMDDADALANDAFRRSRYGALNLIWSPAPSWTMGMELLYGQQQLQDGRSADTLRLQGSLQYSFIK